MLWVVQCTRNSSLNLHLSLVGRLSCAYDLNHLETLFECKPSPAARPINEPPSFVWIERQRTTAGTTFAFDAPRPLEVI